jgi:hypothetical protein
MSVLDSLGAETAALTATALAVASSVPQLRRVIAERQDRGVSIASPMIGIGTELAWVAYAGSSGLWSALPEAVLMVVANTALVLALARRGVGVGRATAFGAMWAAGLLAVAALAGLPGLAAVLAVGYAVQVAPAVWTVWTTHAPVGVAASTWALVGAEGGLWGVYGIHHGDPATTWFGAIAIAAATASLTRKVTTRSQGVLAAASG